MGLLLGCGDSGGSGDGDAGSSGSDGTGGPSTSATTNSDDGTTTGPSSGPSDDDGSDSADSGSDESSGGEPFEPGTHFGEEHHAWSVPQIEDYHPITLAHQYQATLDMDGDGRLDLVDTATCYGPEGECELGVWDRDGNPHWRVYLGSGERFSDTAIEWSVPTIEGYHPITLAHQYQATLDMDGDGMLDLVDTATCYGPEGECELGVWDRDGSPHWRVYLGDGSGFASNPTQWSVPTIEDYHPITLAHQYQATLDMDGDGRPDLVDTATCYGPEGECELGVWDRDGDPHWRVYSNSGGGFADAPIEWDVPTIEGYHPITLAHQYQATLDMDGDGFLDLVDTVTCYGPEGECELGVWDRDNDPHWRVYVGDGTGFSQSEIAWSVPSIEGYYPLTLAHQYQATLDMNGDGQPDLVDTVTCYGPEGECELGVWDRDGDPHWRVYFSEGDGFADGVHAWSVPTIEGYQPLTLAHQYQATLDMDGDRRPDLVDTVTCYGPEGECELGVWDRDENPHWRVYFGVP